MDKRTSKSRPSTMNSGVPLLRLRGFQIVADWSLLIVFALILTNLGIGLFPTWHPDWSPALTWTVALGAALLLFASVLLHELAHVATARAFGVPAEGVTLFLFGGIAHLKDEPPSPGAECLMALAGPAVSVALGLASLALGGATVSGLSALLVDDPEAAMRSLGVLPTLLFWLGPLNLTLAAFNLIPGFPLDGGRILRAILWWALGDLRRATQWASLGGRFVSWVIIAVGVLMLFGQRVPYFGSGFQGLWLVFIGWFLNNAARTSYEQLVIRESLRGVPVSRLMASRFEVAAPSITVAELMTQLIDSDQRCFPVTSGRHLVGVVSIDDVSKVPQSEWETVPVARIMTPLPDVVTVGVDEDAFVALARLIEHEVDQLPVVVDDQVIGVFRRREAIRWLQLWQEIRRDLDQRTTSGSGPRGDTLQDLDTTLHGSPL